MKQCRACGVLLPSPFFSYFPNSAKHWIPVCKKGAGGLGVGECRVSTYFKFLYSIPLCEFVNQRSYPGIKLLIVV